MMNTRAKNAYAKIQSQTAVSETDSLGLILLVYRRLLDNLRLAQAAMEVGANADRHLETSLDLIQRGLLAALDAERGGDIASNLSALYDWASREVLMARIRREPLILGGVIAVIQDLESAWLEVAEIRAGYSKNQSVSGETGNRVPPGSSISNEAG